MNRIISYKSLDLNEKNGSSQNEFSALKKKKAKISTLHFSHVMRSA